MRITTSSITLVPMLLVSACASIPTHQVGPARASLDVSSLTRAQRIVYGSYYLDFYATLVEESPGRTCFGIRVETDDKRADSALSFSAYARESTNIPSRLTFSSYVLEPSDRYPLVHKGEACTDFPWDKAKPLYVHVTPQYVNGTDVIRLEWSPKQGS